LVIVHTLSMATGTICLSKVADPRYIRLRSIKIAFCIIAFCFLYGRTLFMRHKSPLDRAVL
jgi:hypothetical protein